MAVEMEHFLWQISIGDEGWGTREERYYKIKWGWECTVWEMRCEDGKDGLILSDVY